MTPLYEMSIFPNFQMVSRPVPQHAVSFYIMMLQEVYELLESIAIISGRSIKKLTS